MSLDSIVEYKDESHLISISRIVQLNTPLCTQIATAVMTNVNSNNRIKFIHAPSSTVPLPLSIDKREVVGRRFDPLTISVGIRTKRRDPSAEEEASQRPLLAEVGSGSVDLDSLVAAPFVASSFAVSNGLQATQVGGNP